MANKKKAASVREPRQARSLRTQERLLDAMEFLLQRREPADITVEDIVERAHASVGAFYKRFASKQDLLPLLLTRLQTNARRELEEELQKPRWNGRGLTERVNALIDMFAGVQIQRQRIIRACVAGRLSASLQMSTRTLRMRAHRSRRCETGCSPVATRFVTSIRKPPFASACTCACNLCRRRSSSRRCRPMFPRR
jgi:AcrR family transcriptional regulator